MCTVFCKPLLVTTEYISFLQEMKQGQCICPLSWSVHCNFTGEGKCNERGWATGRQCTVPFSVQKWIISRRRCAMLLNISSEKSKVTRELALVELSLACLMVTWKFYDGSSKRITILSILVRSDQLLSTICFCIPSYVHQQLHLLNFQNLAHAIL
jgi:hypothetical protein